MSITHAVFSVEGDLVDLLHSLMETQLIEAKVLQGKEIAILKKIEKKGNKILITFHDNKQMEVILRPV